MTCKNRKLQISVTKAASGNCPLDITSTHARPCETVEGYDFNSRHSVHQVRDLLLSNENIKSFVSSRERKKRRSNVPSETILANRSKKGTKAAQTKNRIEWDKPEELPLCPVVIRSKRSKHALTDSLRSHNMV